jgi:hypothetical protein
MTTIPMLAHQFTASPTTPHPLAPVAHLWYTVSVRQDIWNEETREMGGDP